MRRYCRCCNARFLPARRRGAVAAQSGPLELEWRFVQFVLIAFLIDSFGNSNWPFFETAQYICGEAWCPAAGSSGFCQWPEKCHWHWSGRRYRESAKGTAIAPHQACCASTCPTAVRQGESAGWRAWLRCGARAAPGAEDGRAAWLPNVLAAIGSGAWVQHGHPDGRPLSPPPPGGRGRTCGTARPPELRRVVDLALPILCRSACATDLAPMIRRCASCSSGLSHRSVRVLRHTARRYMPLDPQRGRRKRQQARPPPWGSSRACALPGFNPPDNRAASSPLPASSAHRLRWTASRRVPWRSPPRCMAGSLPGVRQG